MFFTSLLLLACQHSEEEPLPQWDGPRVIVLVLDGVRDEESFGDGISPVSDGPPETLMPNSWEQLVPQGARATRVLNAGITTTGPAHATLLVGARQALGNYEVTEEVGLYRTELPTLYEAARDQLGLDQGQLSLLGNVSLIQPMTHSRSPEGGWEYRAWFGLVGEVLDDPHPESGGRDDRVVFESLKQNLLRREPVLSVVNFHQVDRATHGAGREVYGDHLTILDEELPLFWNWLQEQEELADRTWVFVLSDHGRHDQAATDPSWQTHGDSCAGCRGVPWMVLGPGVSPGATEATILLEDVAPTVAALLGVDLPWAEGLVATSLTGTAGNVRTGPGELTASGDAVLEARFTSDPDHRSKVWLNDTPVSDPEALLAGGIAVFQDQDETWTCHRSLKAAPEDGRLPWKPFCGHALGGTWTDLALPLDEVSPHWVPSLVPTPEGGVAVVSVYDPEGATVPGHDSDEGLRVLHWQDDAWRQHDKRLEVSFPTAPSAAWHEDDLVVVFAAGLPGRDSRHTRRLYQTTLDTTTDTWDTTVVLDLVPEGSDDVRLERPALTRDGSELLLSAVGHVGSRTVLVRALSSDGGASWTSLPEPEPSHPVLPHVTPVQDSGQTWFAVLDTEAEEALVCRVDDQHTSHCQGTGSPRIRDLALSDIGVELIVDSGVGAWVRETLPR